MTLERPTRPWLLPGLVCLGLVLAAALGRGPAARAAAEPAASEAEAAAADAKQKDEKPVPTNVVWKLMNDGGLLMWVLLGCSIFGLTFVCERFVALRHERVIPRPFVARFLQQVREGDLDRDQALEVCAANASPMAEVFGGGARKWGRPSVEVEQGVIDAGERVAHGLRRYIRIFSALTVIAPLIGLLGCVLGMILTFNEIARHPEVRGNPVTLAKGISVALLNTAFGLVVAIPAQSFYYYFLSRVDQLVIEMDRWGQDLVHMISAEELAERKPDNRSRKA